MFKKLCTLFLVSSLLLGNLRWGRIVWIPSFDQNIAPYCDWEYVEEAD